MVIPGHTMFLCNNIKLIQACLFHTDQPHSEQEKQTTGTDDKDVKIKFTQETSFAAVEESNASHTAIGLSEFDNDDATYRMIVQLLHDRDFGQLLKKRNVITSLTDDEKYQWLKKI